MINLFWRPGGVEIGAGLSELENPLAVGTRDVDAAGVGGKAEPLAVRRPAGGGGVDDVFRAGRQE